MSPTLRTVLAPLAGYLTMGLAVFLLFTGSYLLLGAEGSFKPGSWEPSNTWLAIGVVVGLSAAFLGGTVAQLIDRTGRGSWILIGFVAVLGLITAIFAYINFPEAIEPRTIAVPSSIDAMNGAISPLWMEFLNPILGCAGIYAAKLTMCKQCCNVKDG